ncbi:MAG: NTP transferase domain-containing protein [Pseudomonadota bacterium]
MLLKAIILSAGQGRRLLPLTQRTPKCALDVAGQSALEWQLGQIAQTAIDEVVVMTGFQAPVVEAIVSRFHGVPVRTIHNPFYAACDNLGTCWLARPEMDRDFVIMNGDTLFEAAVLHRLLDAPPTHGITLCIDRKASYDDDDMKVVETQGTLRRVGKQLPGEPVNAESIGLMSFRHAGPQLFSDQLDRMMRDESSLKRWYLSAIDGLAPSQQVGVCSIEGLSWCEVDDAADLAHAATVVRTWPTAPRAAGDAM